MTFCCQLNQVSLCAKEKAVGGRERVRVKCREGVSLVIVAAAAVVVMFVGNLCIKYLQQVLLIVRQAYVYK